MKSRRVLHLMTLAALWPFTTVPVAVSPSEQEIATPSAQNAPLSSEYQVGPGDVLSIEVAGVAAEKVRVSNSGKIHLTLLGIVRVSEMTSTELEAEISRLLVERDLVKRPWVTVRVVDYLSQPVYILGEVELPGQYAIRGNLYLADLIAMANGPNEQASSVVFLYRRTANPTPLQPQESPADEAIRIDLDALNEGRNPEQNYKLKGGDVVYVPQAAESYFFLIGDVKAPARYTLRRGGLLASRALVTGGGALKTAKLNKAILIRVDREGVRHELPLDFSAILRGRKPDVAVEVGDIIYVPGSTTKNLAYAMTAVVPGTIIGGLLRLPR